MRLLKIFTPKHSQTPESIVDVPSRARPRSSTAITALEEELGMCEPPKSGLLSKFHIPKREEPTTQAPEPRRSPSFFQGSWVTLWACQADGEQDCELDQDVATPTNATAWSSDELTPRFSSYFPRTPYPNALRGEAGEGQPNGELPGISAPNTIRPDTLR